VTTTRRSALSLAPELVVAAVYVVSMFMNIMDSTIVNVALPAIAREFGVAIQATDGVVVSYLISVAVWIPASGWLGDRFGTKRTFLFALAVFTVGSALCGQAQSLLQLVVFRVIQGIGGGMLTPVGMAMLFRAFPPRRRARASQILIVPTVIAPAIGPVLGGFLVDQLSWRWAFYINVPIGLLALVFGLIYLQEHRESNVGAFDLAGFLLAAVGFALLLLALSEGPAIGWLQPIVVIALVCSIASLALLVRVELRKTAPLVDLRLFANRLFTVTNLVSFGGSAGFIGLLFLLPLFLQDVVGVPAVVSGLTTFPEAVGVLVGTQFAGRLYPTVGPRRLLIGGLVWVTAIIGTMTVLDGSPDLWVVRVQMFLVGAGMAFVVLPLQAASFATISSADTGRASAIFSTQRQLAAAFGVAVLASVLAAGGTSVEVLQAPSAAQLGAFRLAFGVAAAFTALGALAASAIPDRDAASTMRARTTNPGSA
jgi:EmrB/QacA subfamily drug resistance transporter